MSRRPKATRRTTVKEVARYYRDATGEYHAYGGAALSWNHGIWEPDVRSLQAAFQRGKEFLVRGLELGPARRVLDVGCGVGGFAIWCAAKFGCHVTGITVCEEHIPLAFANAEAAGISGRCDFRLMDMDALEVASESFDVVVNQETLCCARNKPRYLREVFRILAPGGAWRAIDYNLRRGPLTSAESEQVRKLLKGFRLPSLIPAANVEAQMKSAGFVECASREVTELVLPTAGLIMRRSREPVRLARRYRRRHLHSHDAGEEASIRGHFEAGMEYAVGLHTGLFEHTWYRARKAIGS
jgi:cyclopropane-fatty-acyl-phospholipid synthase